MGENKLTRVVTQPRPNRESNPRPLGFKSDAKLCGLLYSIRSRRRHCKPMPPATPSVAAVSSFDHRSSMNIHRGADSAHSPLIDSGGGRGLRASFSQPVVSPRALTGLPSRAELSRNKIVGFSRLNPAGFRRCCRSDCALLAAAISRAPGPEPRKSASDFDAVDFE